MRIVYITANLPYGANEAFIAPEVRGLVGAGHDVLVVPRSPRGFVLHGRDLLRRARCERLCSIRVCTAAAAIAARHPFRTAAALLPLLGSGSASHAIKNAAVIPKALWLARLASRWNAGHIHCHWAGTTATIAMIASQVSGIPWSLTAHRWDIVERNLLAEKLHSASFARFISNSGIELARAAGVKTGDRVRVLHMGVAVSEQVRRKATGRPVVLCPARLTAVKGHASLLRAWRILQNRGQDAELWLAGDGELRPELEALAAELDLAGSVKFLGTMPHSALLDIYAQGLASAVVLASVDLGAGVHEGIPVALIEAMSYGIPVVATASGGTAELITPEAGRLVPPGNAAALADALQPLLEDASLAERIGAAGRQRVVESFEIGGVVAELAAAFAGTHRETRAARGGARLRAWVERLSAGAALLASSPVLLAAAAAIFLESGPPVLFRQTRVGIGGQPFTLLKFRSMRTGVPGGRITAGGDPRVTCVGRVLRKYKLDELPQLWNILAGHMQFIGPRPELPSLVDLADQRWHAVLRQKPGLTDLSTLVYRDEEAVLGNYPDPDQAYRERVLPHKLSLSMRYLNHRSIWSDLKLLFLTVRYSLFPAGFCPDRVARTFLGANE